MAAKSAPAAFAYYRTSSAANVGADKDSERRQREAVALYAKAARVEVVRQILGAVSHFEKAFLVAKLRGARDRKRADTGRCEGRKPVPAEVVAEARRLARKNPKTGERRSLREIAGALAVKGMLGPSVTAYHPGSITAMLSPTRTPTV